MTCFKFKGETFNNKNCLRWTAASFLSCFLAKVITSTLLSGYRDSVLCLVQSSEASSSISVMETASWGLELGTFVKEIYWFGIKGSFIKIYLKIVVTNYVVILICCCWYPSCWCYFGFYSFDLGLCLGSHLYCNNQVATYENSNRYDECNESCIDAVTFWQVIVRRGARCEVIIFGGGVGICWN